MNDKVNTNENSDKELLKLVKKEKSFFGEVYKRYYKKIFNYIRRRVESKSICEDLTSEVFEKAYNAIDDFKWQGISISAWLFRIAKNLLTDYYRKSGRIGEIISLSEIESFLEGNERSLYSDYIKDEEENVLYNTLREFNEKEQYLLYYKFFEDLTNKEISKIVGISESNVGTKLYRIRKKLKIILQSSNIFK